MRTITIRALLVTLLVTLAAPSVSAGVLDGTVKLGGIILDEEGDLSSVQETYNIHDGFSLTEIRLNGNLDPRNYFTLHLQEINLDSRKGDFVYRVPGAFKFTASFDQHRQVFDPQRNVTSERRDWQFGARFSPARWVRVSGSFNYLSRDGERLPFPSGETSLFGTTTSTVSALGTRYDHALKTGQLSAEVRKDRRGIGVTYRVSDFADQLNSATDRTGQVVSARLFAPSFFYDKLTHLLRGAYGVNELSNGNLNHTLMNFQYTGVVRPVTEFQFKYNFEAQRIVNESSILKTHTNRFQNNVDATYFHKHGNVAGGYGYETNDDERGSTHYHSWRAGATLRYEKLATAKIHYAGRVKKDEEELTLLRDVEASRFRGDLEVRPLEGLEVGGGFNFRERDYPDIDVKSKGHAINSRAQYSLKDWGNLSGDYTYSKDEYTDLAGAFDASSHLLTGRVNIERIKNLGLSSGVTYMKVGENLDLEKWMVFMEGRYTVVDDLHLEVKYNIYNYDDFVLLDRYYSANVVWINVAYDLHVE